MTASSQTLKEFAKEKKLDQILIDADLKGRDREFFEKAPVHLDPKIYKGDFKAYRNEQKYESANEQLKRLAEKSDTLQGWISGQLYDAEKKLSPNKRGYKFGRDTAGYGSSFEDVAKQYLMNEGKKLYGFLRGKGRDFTILRELVGLIWAAQLLLLR